MSDSACPSQRPGPRPVSTRPVRDQCGSAAVLTLVLCTALVFLALAGSVLAGMLVAQRRAQSAADLAGLAGADALAGAQLRTAGLPGRGGSACDAVTRVARANGAVVTTCTVGESTVTVRVTVATSPVWGVRWAGVGQARAGPVQSPP